MELLAIGAIAAFGGLVTAAIAALSRAQRRTYQQAAAALGGRYESGGWSRNAQVVATLGGATVIVTTRAVSTGNTTVVYRRAVAALVRPDGVHWKVYRQGIMSSLGKAMGTQDVELGLDPDFDQAYMVKSDRVAVTRRYWLEPALRHGMSFFRGATAACDGATITLEETGSWSEVDLMVKAARLVAGLASADVYGAGEVAGGVGLRHVPDARFVDGAPPAAEVATPERVVITAEDVDGRLVTVARYQGHVGVPPLGFDNPEDGRPAGHLLASLPQAAHIQLARTGAGRLMAGVGGARFVWPDIEMDPQRLRAGADLVGALAAAAGDGGLYR